MKAKKHQTGPTMIAHIGDRREALGHRIRAGNSSPALEEGNEDLLNPDESTATFDYVLGQSDNQFTCDQFTCDSTATKGGGIREDDAYALLEMADLQLAPLVEMSSHKNKGREDKLSLFYKHGQNLDDGTPVQVVPSLMFRMDGRMPGVYEQLEIRNAKMAWGFLQIMDPELLEHVHSPTLPDCHHGIDYLRTIVKQIGNEYVSHCKRACVEFMQTAWKSGKSSDSRLVGFPDVLKVIENIGGTCKRAEEDPMWETIYNIWTGLFQAKKLNSPGSWLMTYMKKHFHLRVDSDMNSPLNCRFKELFRGSASSKWVASMARERYANGPGRTIDRKTKKAVQMKISDTPKQMTTRARL
jgi:hypothetical protein